MRAEIIWACLDFGKAEIEIGMEGDLVESIVNTRSVWGKSGGEMTWWLMGMRGCDT